MNPTSKSRGIRFDYVMQPCDVKLKYLGIPWFTVQLEVGHNEIGDVAWANGLIEKIDKA